MYFGLDAKVPLLLPAVKEALDEEAETVEDGRG
jgi:hypothetical protein